MNPTFHPIPRISTAPSGKISHPSPAPPWTLPPTAESSPAPAREVECFSCRKSTSVPATAVSARCGHCSAYIKLDDVILHSRTHRTKVQTCGSVTVQANADLKGLNIECRDLVLYGRASGDFLCRGVCKIKTDQHISGSISARRMVVEKRRRCWSQEPSAWKTSGYRGLWKERLRRMKPSPSTGTPNSWEISRRAASSLRKAGRTREPLPALRDMNLPISIRARASTTSGTWIWIFRPTSSSYSAALPAPENLPWRLIRFFRIPQAFSGLPVGTLQAGHGSTGKPEVDSITGLPPALCLEQSARQQSSRTLLGSITEILDYLRILYAAAGTPHDPETGKELERKSPDRITEELVSLPEHTRLILAAPAENLLAQDPAATLGDFQRQGFLRVYWNGEMRDIEEISSPVPPPPDAALVIDRLIVRGKNTASRIADSLQTALRINPDEVRAIITIPGEEASIRAFHTRYRNPETGFLLPQLTPRHFSFNSPLGACPSCRGTGLNEQENGPCRACGGQRLSPLALAVTMPAPDRAYNLAELTALPLEDMAGELERLKTPSSLAAALTPLMEEINKRVRFLNELGLSYLSLDRQANTLSGGELQRARLASQLGGGLSGVLYILDEPTAGLHPADTDRLLRALRTLRNQGNTVLVVEHDEQILTAADHLVDMGPGSGTNGGRILAQGSLAEILENAESPTGEWLSGKRNMPASGRKTAPAGRLVLTGADKHNLNNVTLNIPVGTLTCISGPSGSGKSTLVRDCLIPAVRQDLSGKRVFRATCREQNTSTASSSSTSRPSAKRRAPHRPPLPACSRCCAPFTHSSPFPSRGDIRRRAFPPTFAEAAVNVARERA